MQAEYLNDPVTEGQRTGLALLTAWAHEEHEHFSELLVDLDDPEWTIVYLCACIEVLVWRHQLNCGGPTVEDVLAEFGREIEHSASL